MPRARYYLIKASLEGSSVYITLYYAIIKGELSELIMKIQYKKPLFTFPYIFIFIFHFVSLCAAALAWNAIVNSKYVKFYDEEDDLQQA